MNTENVYAVTLREGDVVLQEDFHRKEKFEVEIVSGPVLEKQQFGRRLVFQGKVIAGPRIVGESGRVSYGEKGLAKLVRRKSP